MPLLGGFVVNSVSLSTNVIKNLCKWTSNAFTLMDDVGFPNIAWIGMFQKCSQNWW